MSHLLEGLTDAQAEAVQHLHGPLLILAGPGSGKTRVVTHRVAYLLEQGVPGHQVLALTFTNKAAEEMRTRIEHLAADPSVWVSTFHRFCARLLRQYALLAGLQENFTIYDTDDSGKVLRRIIVQKSIDPTQVRPASLASAISWAKNRLITPATYQADGGHPLGPIVKQVYPAYQSRLQSSNAVDFDDLLMHVAVLLRDNPEIRRELDDRYRFILVDEYQDTNLAQYAIARSLAIDHPNLAVTGDPDQSIYGWRGANLNNILEFERDFPDVRVVRLERNYRSTGCILRVASELITHNRRRKEKNLYTENGEGTPVRLVTYTDHREEAQGIASRIAEAVEAGRRRPRDFAIFYRVNALSWPFELALRERGIPYQIIRGQEFFQRKEVKDVLAYLQLLNNPRDDVALLRVINTPARGIGKVTLDRLSDHATSVGLSLLDASAGVRHIGSIAARTAAKVEKFVTLIGRLGNVAATSSAVEEILGYVLAETGYRDQFTQSNTEEDQQRLENIEELLSIAREFDERGENERPLEAFLEETSLINDTDAWETENDRVTLMTLHASKGLEFPAVFLVAVEEGLLPHERSRDRPNQLEEERRLTFVGVTRAQEELQLSRAERRDFRGQRRMTVPSQFLMEIPRGDMDVYDSTAVTPSWAEPEPRTESHEGFPWETPSPTPRMPEGSRLVTAAEMAGEPTSSTVDPDAFHQDMVVRHPRHGLGRVVALGGSGTRRTATVQFTASAGRRKFVIAKSDLRPVRS